MAPMAAELDVETAPTQVVKAKPHPASFPFFVGEPSPLLTPQLTPQEQEAAKTPLAEKLSELFAENVAAKLWKVAVELGDQEGGITRFPEHVPTHGADAGHYATREHRFWTCGFFPGSLYAVLERCIRYPRSVSLPPSINQTAFRQQLLQHCRTWAAPLHASAQRTNTHDLGFITQPALRLDWELTGNEAAFRALVTAAHNLASRYDHRMRAIRSWDTSFSRRYEITDMEANFMVIVDSMCNLDLLFYVGHHTGNQRLIDIATAHARFVAQQLIRDDHSTWHVANFDPRTGSCRARYTHQGYSDDSTWSRGQAWTILGFAQTYMWTRDPSFLHTAQALTTHFLQRLTTAPHAFPFVPAWDFDAPADAGDFGTRHPSSIDGTDRAHPPLRDASAGMIAANGLLVLHAALGHASPYLAAAVRIARETAALCVARDTGAFVATEGDGAVAVQGVTFDAILTHATANNNPWALVRYGDHGLVYADYFFVEFGNKLLRMGLV